MGSFRHYPKETLRKVKLVAARTVRHYKYFEETSNGGWYKKVCHIRDKDILQHWCPPMTENEVRELCWDDDCENRDPARDYYNYFKGK
jgi:hypothetical protein